MENGLLTDLFVSNESYGCFNYTECPLVKYAYGACKVVHSDYRYSDASAAWILICAIIVFFMKAGFLLIELAFAQNLREKRHVVVVKHLDVFASAFGFFLFGFNPISNYNTINLGDKNIFRISDPILWFFKFTFASNAATIMGGCLVTNKYKLRLFAAFLNSFIISGITHPLIARLIWSDVEGALFSPYKFCDRKIPELCNQSFSERMYILDFAGGGAVHLVGGVAGLVLCLFAKWQKFCEKRNRCLKRSDQQQETENQRLLSVREQPEIISRRDFWEWMYPVDGGGETTSEAALGVLILWFCWFAFNCGSTESLESISQFGSNSYHALPSVIAINMILAAASGGVVAVVIASWAQIRSNSDSVNANEIANGVLSSLVAITSGCPFVDYWAACVIGVIAVILYHGACWLEYKLGVEDTARVVPVHGMCGLWSMIAVGLFLSTDNAKCNLHVTFEGLCYCNLRLPELSFGERLASQILGALLMIVITGGISFILYTILYIIPIKPRMTSETRFANGYNRFTGKLFKIVFNREQLQLEGNLLFTGPSEIPHPTGNIPSSLPSSPQQQPQARNDISRNVSYAEHAQYGGNRETMGSVDYDTMGSIDSILSQSIPNTTESKRNISTRNRNTKDPLSSIELNEPRNSSSTSV